MGGGGGGSAGKVEYPAYLMSMHQKFLDNNGADSPSLSVVDLLNDAYVSSPFDGVTSYTGRVELGTNLWTVGQSLAEILSLDTDAITLFSSQFDPVAQSVQDLFDLNSLQTALLQDSQKAEEEKQKLLSAYLGKQVLSGTIFSSAFVQGCNHIIDAKMRSVMAAGGDQISKSILQIGQHKLTNVLNLINTQWMNFKVSKTSYHMAIEECKLTILNEREYFEQNEFYKKYAAHWRFECMQAGFNGLATNMGKRMTWFESPDAPGWAVDAMLIAGYGVGDFVGTSLVKKNKRFRVAMYNAGTGAASGAATGAMGGGIGAIPGLIIGGVLGGVMSYVNYKEGEWR